MKSNYKWKGFREKESSDMKMKLIFEKKDMNFLYSIQLCRWKIRDWIFMEFFIFSSFECWNFRWNLLIFKVGFFIIFGGKISESFHQKNMAIITKTNQLCSSQFPPLPNNKAKFPIEVSIKGRTQFKNPKIMYRKISYIF